jgi:cell pole-organizing protein PopZ
MRKTEPPPEPSIEEILASIRRIISDDGDTPAEPAFDPYDSENVRKQAERGQAGEPVGDVRSSEPATVAQPIMRDEQSNTAVSPHDATLARRNDEIFELTDDCLLEELEASRAAASQRKTAGLGEAIDTATAIEKSVASLASNAPEIGDAEDAEQASVESAKFDIPPLPSEEEIAEINSVLTNVVAEMHRITDVTGFEPPAEMHRPTDVKGFEPPTDLMPGMPEPRSASAASPSSHATKPQASTRPSAPATPTRKPAWSARNRSAIEKPKQTSASETDAAKSAEATAISEAADTASEAANAASKQPSPLMEAIATTLVTALADTNERQENARATDAEAAAPGADPAVADAQEPLPEEVVAPDMDEAALESSAAKPAAPDDAYDVSASEAPKEEASETSQAAGIETPELPSEDTSNAVASSRAAMPSETPQEGEDQPTTTPTPTMQKKASASPEAASAHMDGLQAAALPAGLEDSVQEVLKPMLAEWLDQNLPRLVEKALSDELAKRDLSKTE